MKKHGIFFFILALFSPALMGQEKEPLSSEKVFNYEIPPDSSRPPTPEELSDTPPVQTVTPPNYAPTITSVEVTDSNDAPIPGVASVVANWKGRSLTEETFNQIATEAQAVFTKSGVMGTIAIGPRNNLQKGQVHFVAHPTRLKSVTSSGQRWYSKSFIERSLGLKAGEPMTRQKLDRARLAEQNLNSNARLKVTSLLNQVSATEQELTLSVRDRFPVEASITMTDPGTASSDELRLDLGARYHDFWRSGQVLGYNLGTSSEFDLDRSQSHSAFWVIPFYQTGDSLSFQAAYTKSSSSVILDDLQFRGTGVQASAQYTHILPRWGGWTHQLSWGPSYKFSENNLSLAGTPVTESETGLFSLQTQYAGTLQDKWGISSLTLIASGAPGNLVGADRSADYTRVRTGADPTFWNFNWGVGRSQQLPLEMVLNLKAQGQLVSGPLLSTEQFALGGINSVRGYNENQILSDEGVNLRAELLSPNLMKKVGLKNAGDFRLLVFTDYGSSHLLQPQAGQVAYEELLSAGTGVQYRFLDYLSAHVVFGQTLNELPGMTHDSRIHFQIRASY